MWSDKYSPKKIADIKGQEKAVAKIKEWLRNPKKGLLAYGPPGVGKTALAYTIANEMGWEIVEMNASDFRRKGDIQERLVNAALQKSLFNKGKLILVDEVDGLAGRRDMGAASTIAELIKKSKHPVYLTCNNAWANPVKTIRNSVSSVEFVKPKTSDIVFVLERIAKLEGISVDRSLLLQIASSRDMRSSIADFQSLYESGELSKDGVDKLGTRDRTKTIFEALRDVFKAQTVSQASGAFDGLNKRIDEFMLWIDENIQREYVGGDIFRAYEALSKADVFYGRIYRRQDWKLLKHVIAQSTIGVAMAKTRKNEEFIGYRPPTFLLMMGRTRETRAVRKGLLNKIAKATHTSRKRAMEYLQVMRILAKKGELPFELTEGELSFLNYM
ncbi:MAG: replication factor C large subunit [Candidatus Altiarchaeota archaeon]|nr:replication factor C large subunit [Candidatus Altiarchaeota archaeon]